MADDAKFVRRNENAIWENEDKHARAYQKLSEPRARQIAEILQTDVVKDKRCLNCHAVPMGLIAEKKLVPVTEGVGCEACHGPASAWGPKHGADPDWIRRELEYKSSLGMWNVRDPVTHAAICLSCHLGSVKEGRVVTHEMYAAGHPPLPGFEVVTWSREMPLHWRYAKQKDPKFREISKVQPWEHEETKLAVIGHFVALKTAADLVAGETAASSESSVVQAHWPELASFECYACHHDLRSPSWRQRRGFPGLPGRPHLSQWIHALIPALLEATGQDAKSKDRFRELLARFYKLLDARPFGNSGDLNTAARDLSAWSEELIGRLKAYRFDQSASLRILHDLIRRAPEATVDFDCARQLAWTCGVIYRDMDPRPKNDKKIEEFLQQLRRELKLDLPAGTKNEILSDLPAHLLRLNEYDPQAAQRLFAEFGRLLDAAN
jgi:hypothetical protein